MKLTKTPISSLLDWGQQELADLGPEEAKASTERLLEETLDCERAFLYLNAAVPVSKKQALRFRRFILKRKTRVPVAYLLQKAGFWNEILEVRPGCLIPRPETEILVESFIRDSGFQKNSSFSFLDLGSGTGAIGIAILRNFPNARATFSDISKKALAVTRLNLERYELLHRSEIIESDLFKSFPNVFVGNRQVVDPRQKHPGMTCRWDAILSNPPYVAGKDLAGLEPELKFEPVIALDGGEDGLDFYRAILRDAGHFLHSNGIVMLEMGAGQSQDIAKLSAQFGFTGQKILKDYAGIERVLTVRI